MVKHARLIMSEISGNGVYFRVCNVRKLLFLNCFWLELSCV